MSNFKKQRKEDYLKFPIIQNRKFIFKTLNIFFNSNIFLTIKLFIN